MLAGLASGALSWVLSTALYKVEDPVRQTADPLDVVAGASARIAVGIGGYLQPRALGVGYDVIGDLLQNRLVLSVALASAAVQGR